MNKRIDKVESSSQKQQPPKAHDVQQWGRNPYRYADEYDYGEELDEDCAPHINLSRFKRGNENKKVE